MKKGSQILLGLVIASSILLIAAAPEWIQYNERVVGENSPYYTDVVNRPAKQIWGNFTSQHDASGGHKASIFPTAIPTAVFPTPLPTATPGPDFPTPLPTATPGPEFPTPLPTATPAPDFPTPLPTATPGPDFPTPLPTATPLSTYILNHTADVATNIDHSLLRLVQSPISGNYAINPAIGECHGAMINHTITPGTITLPSLADINTYQCHTIRISVIQNAGTTIVTAGANTTFLFPGNDAATTLTSTATPKGFFLQLYFDTWVNKWIVAIERGTWTAS